MIVSWSAKELFSQLSYISNTKELQYLDLNEKARWETHQDTACGLMVWFGWLVFMAYQPL